jgi:pyruvate dehydrogenase E1 component alpha subunit
MDGGESVFAITGYLDSAGIPLKPLPESLAGREPLLHLYRVMVLTRLFDRAAINLQRTGELGTYPSCNGQEAVGAGVGFAMRRDDVFVPYYRDIATQVQRGVLLEEILLYWGGDERGSCFREQAQDFPVCVPIATQCCHAVGVAYAMKFRGEARAVVVTCGDGATSKGDFYESLNVAGAMKLPVVFVVNNNQWAISVPLARQTAAQTIAQKAMAAGIPGFRVDGNDPIAVAQVVDEALHRARGEQRPALVEALTYRLCDHTTADDASRYRDQAEVDAAQQLEPLARFRAYLRSRFDWSDTEENALYHDCEAQVSTSVAAYRATPEQPPGDFFQHMFAVPTAALKRQKEEWLLEHKHHG